VQSNLKQFITGGKNVGRIKFIAAIRKNEMSTTKIYVYKPKIVHFFAAKHAKTSLFGDILHPTKQDLTNAPA